MESFILSNDMTISIKYNNTIFGFPHTVYLDIKNRKFTTIFGAKFNIKSIPMIYYIFKEDKDYHKDYIKKNIFYADDGMLVYVFGTIPKLYNKEGAKILNSILDKLLKLYKAKQRGTSTLKELLHTIMVQRNNDKYIIDIGKSLYEYALDNGAVIQFDLE